MNLHDTVCELERSTMAMNRTVNAIYFDKWAIEKPMASPVNVIGWQPSPSEKTSIFSSFSGRKMKKRRPRAKSWPKGLSKNRCAWAWEVFMAFGKWWFP